MKQFLQAIPGLWLLFNGGLVFAFDSGDIASDSHRGLDIADHFAFQDGSNLYLALTFGRGEAVEKESDLFDGQNRFGLHIDADGDLVADLDFYFYSDGGQRFAVNYGKIDLRGTLHAAFGNDDVTVFGAVIEDPTAIDVTGWQRYIAESGRCPLTEGKGLRCIDAETQEVPDPENDNLGQQVGVIVLRVARGLLGDASVVKTWATSGRAKTLADES